eukprot:722466_1
MANQIDCAKFIELGKKQFTKICRTATIIAGPANTLYRQIKTRYDAEEDVEEETQEEGKANTEEHTQEEGEEGKENKTCVSMTQQQFIEVILFHFHEYNRKKNMESDVETFKSILMKNSIDYMTFLSMKSKGFNALMKGTMKKGQSVGIYKAVAKRIEAERQESFVPLMEAQLSNYGDLRHQLSKQDTVTLLNLLHKDKEIDQRFVRDATKIHIFENKLKSKMPSIKTGVAIQIFHGLHDLVDIETEMETETKQKAETKTETERNMETKENTGPTMVALEDLTVDQFADVVIAMLHQNDTIKEDTFDFGKLRQVILEEKIDGKQFQKYSKKEFSTVFKKAHVPVGITRKLMKRVQTEVVIQLPEPESLAQAQTQPQTKYQPHVQTQSVAQAKPQPPPQPSPQPVKEITAKPPPQPVKEITPKPSPQPVKEITAKPPPQPVKEITPKPSPQPVKEITAKPPPQPVKEITPKPPVQKITLDTRDLDGPSQYIAKLNEFQISKIVKNLADESLLKLFDQIKNGIHQNQINGKMLVQQINDKTEDEFKLFFAQNIHSKCTKLSSDLYLMLRNNNAKRKKVSDKSCEELIKYCVYTLTQKIGELIVDEEIDGIKYLELGKAGVTRKLNEYLSFGLARRLVANMDHYLNEAYVVQAQPQQSHHMLQLTPQHSLSRSDFESSVGIAASIQMEDEDGEEEEESKYSQTLGLSEVVPFINNYSMQMQSNGNAKDVESEENELAQFAVQCYKKSNKRSLKQCRQNVYKQDLNALLPHIVIDSSQKPLQVMKPKHGAEHGAATTISISFNKLTEDEEEDDDGEDEEDKKGQNLSGIKCEFVSFLPRIKAIYKINDKEDTFYRTLFEDVMLEKNGFSNTMHKYEIQEWLANYECNRIKYVIQQHTINYKQFRILSKHKLRDNKEYFGFLPKKRRRKLYDELVKYINNNR